MRFYSALLFFFLASNLRGTCGYGERGLGIRQMDWWVYYGLMIMA